MQSARAALVYEADDAVRTLCLREDLNYPTPEEARVALKRKKGKMPDVVSFLKKQAKDQDTRWHPKVHREAEPLAEPERDSADVAAHTGARRSEQKPEAELEPEPADTR
jgi:hypothetical protein